MRKFICLPVVHLLLDSFPLGWPVAVNWWYFASPNWFYQLDQLAKWWARIEKLSLTL